MGEEGALMVTWLLVTSSCTATLVGVAFIKGQHLFLVAHNQPLLQSKAESLPFDEHMAW